MHRAAMLELHLMYSWQFLENVFSFIILSLHFTIPLHIHLDGTLAKITICMYFHAEKISNVSLPMCFGAICLSWVNSWLLEQKKGRHCSVGLAVPELFFGFIHCKICSHCPGKIDSQTAGKSPSAWGLYRAVPWLWDNVPPGFGGHIWGEEAHACSKISLPPTDLGCFLTLLVFVRSWTSE